MGGRGNTNPFQHPDTRHGERGQQEGHTEVWMVWWMCEGVDEGGGCVRNRPAPGVACRTASL